MTDAVVKLLPLSLFSGIDPTATSALLVSMKALNTCSRHQLHLQCYPDPPASGGGTATVKGVTFNSGLLPGYIDSRLDAISFASVGSRVIIFYGVFDQLQFSFSGWSGGANHNLLSAAIVSHSGPLLYSGDNP